MKLKTSYFNKAVFKKDMTQFWSLWAVEIVISLLIFIMPLMSRVNGIIREYTGNTLNARSDIKESLISFTAVLANPVFLFVMAIVVAVVVFQYTFNSREMYMIHSLPVKRETLFISHYIAGVVMLLIPYVIGFAGYLIVGKMYCAGLTISLLLLAFEVFAMILLFYGIACMVVMVSGNSIMSISIYCVLNVLYIGLYMMFMSVNQMFSYADRTVDMENILTGRYAWLSPIVFLYRKTGFKWTGVKRWSDSTSLKSEIIRWSEILPFVCAFAAAIIIFIAALLLYKYRKSETVGDMIAFSWGKPVYRTVFAIAGGMFFALISWTVYFQQGVADTMNGEGAYDIERLMDIVMLLMICVIICYFVSEMMLKRTFFIWKSFSRKNFLIVVGGMLMFLVLEVTGVIGIKIPKLNNISELEITSENNILYTDKDDISKFVKLNKEIEEKRLKSDGDSTCGVSFCYRLKNGTKREFSYELPTGQGTISDKIVRCANRSKQKYEAVFSKAYKDGDYKLQNVEVQDCDGNSESTTYASTEEAIEKIYEAVLKDIEAGNVNILDLSYQGESDDKKLNFRTYVNEKMADKYKMGAYERISFYVNNKNQFAEKKMLNISFKAKHTRRVIEELTNDGTLKLSDSKEQYYE